jgi:hypothetical protein
MCDLANAAQPGELVVRGSQTLHKLAYDVKFYVI